VRLLDRFVAHLGGVVSSDDADRDFVVGRERLRQQRDRGSLIHADGDLRSVERQQISVGNVVGDDLGNAEQHRRCTTGQRRLQDALSVVVGHLANGTFLIAATVVIALAGLGFVVFGRLRNKPNS